jgi:hypothetical protein
MPLNKTPMATVDQSSPSKVPILTPGDISPTVMHQFEHGCRNYFIHKKIITDDQVSLIIGGILDDHINKWIMADHDRLVALSFDAFTIKFCANYLAEDWEEDTLRKLLSMTQGTSTFWDYAVNLQFKNSLLRSTTSHLSDDKLRQQLGAGMEVRLSKKVSTKKLKKVVDFCKWLNKVKHCDEGLCAEREEYERIAKENRDASNCYPNKPSSCHIPNGNNNANISHSAPMFPSTAATSAPHKQCPKLLDSECKLLNENEGCVKC